MSENREPTPAEETPIEENPAETPETAGTPAEPEKEPTAEEKLAAEAERLRNELAAEKDKYLRVM